MGKEMEHSGTKSTKIADIKSDPNNARKHDKRNLQAIADSLSRFGQRKPIVVADGIVIAGNGTLEAAKSLGWTEIATVDASDLSTQDRRAYAIADNRTAELAEWDDAVLAEQLRDLADEGVDLDSLAFDESELAALSGDASDTTESVEPAIKSQYQIIVEVTTEQDAARVSDIIEAEGFRCRVLSC